MVGTIRDRSFAAVEVEADDAEGGLAVGIVGLVLALPGPLLSTPSRPLGCCDGWLLALGGRCGMASGRALVPPAPAAEVPAVGDGPFLAAASRAARSRSRRSRLSSTIDLNPKMVGDGHGE